MSCPRSVASATSADGVPEVPLVALDNLWFQVSGTLCNLRCEHCFISCSPTNHTFELLDLETVQRALADGVELGVREFYFTGGEPFLNRQIVPILEAALALGPTTVLTNGMLFRGDALARLARAQALSPYSLEFRVSVDGPDPETNDPIRGAGTHRKAMHGVRQLAAHGFLPILTCTRTWSLDDEDAVLESFRRVLAEHGCLRPRIKVLPSLKIGAEAERTHGYAEDDRLTAAMMEGFDVSSLVCTSSRVVTDRGVWVCPILVGVPDARMGDTLGESTGAYPLAHGACTTCWAYGSICTNASTARGETGLPASGRDGRG